jgi:hypothetical protein
VFERSGICRGGRQAAIGAKRLVHGGRHAETQHGRLPDTRTFPLLHARSRPSRLWRIFSLRGGRATERCSEGVEFGRGQIGDGCVKTAALGPFQDRIAVARLAAGHFRVVGARCGHFGEGDLVLAALVTSVATGILPTTSMRPPTKGKPSVLRSTTVRRVQTA